MVSLGIQLLLAVGAIICGQIPWRYVYGARMCFCVPPESAARLDLSLVFNARAPSVVMVMTLSDNVICACSFVIVFVASAFWEKTHVYPSSAPT